MDGEREHRKIRVKVIHVHHYHHNHHNHHHHHHNQDTNYLNHQTIHKKQSIYTTSRRTRRHHHSSHRNEEYPANPNNENEYNYYSSDDNGNDNDNDDNEPNSFPNDNEDFNDDDNNYPLSDNDDEIPKPKRPLKPVATYYIPESPEQNPFEGLPPNAQYPYPKPKARSPNPERFPYPIEKLKYLRRHPLPNSDDENPDVIHSPNGDWPKVPRKRIRFISEIDKYSKPKYNDYSYWTEIEAVLTQERLGGYVEIPPKQLPMMYPFTQMSPRKLPWDFSDVELVPTRPNKPMKPFKPKSFAYFEESVLGIMRIPTPGNRSIALFSATDEFDFVESWIRTCLGHPFNYLTELTRFGFSSRFLQLERKTDGEEHSSQKIHLVLYPCESPLNYKKSPLPPIIVTHRCVTNGNDLIYLLRKIKKIKFSFSFLLCAAYLGKEAIDYHPKSIPTQKRIDSLIQKGYGSLFFRECGVESIMIFDTSNVVPLYACKMSSNRKRIK